MLHNKPTKKARNLPQCLQYPAGWPGHFYLTNRKRRVGLVRSSLITSEAISSGRSEVKSSLNPLSRLAESASPKHNETLPIDSQGSHVTVMLSLKLLPSSHWIANANPELESTAKPVWVLCFCV